MKGYLKSKDSTECCGCSACVNICSKHSLTMQPDHEGFLYPVKDTTSCIDCGLCEKVCPFSDDYIFETTTNPQVFAAYDKQHRTGSSSGGIFYTLAQYAINEKKGWVFGATFKDNFQLYHEGVNHLENLNKFRGSKYVQSNMGNTYRRIQELLREGTFVLFVGTPCQVAGLKGFLRKDYDNLLLADLVCHGVPSQWLFDEHIKYLEQQHKAKLTSYKFRKEDGWSVSEIMDFENPKKHINFPSFQLSPYLYSFIKAMTYRESCYKCKFAKIPRQGDITLADYWGVKTFFPDIDTTKGVSLVLTNTKKGETVFHTISKECIVRKSNINDAVTYNGNLITHTNRPEIRTGLYERIKQDGYAKVARSSFRSKDFFIIYTKTKLINIPIIKKLNRILRHRNK